MNKINTRSVELLLEVIADELFMARMDREKKLGINDLWGDGERASYAERIKKTRDRFDSYPDL
jgi:hypothetical protein